MESYEDEEDEEEAETDDMSDEDIDMVRGMQQ